MGDVFSIQFLKGSPLNQMHKGNKFFGGQPIRGKNGVPNISKVLAAVNQDVRGELINDS